MTLQDILSKDCWSGKLALYDLAVTLAILFAVAFACEWSIRRHRDPLSPVGRGAT